MEWLDTKYSLIIINMLIMPVFKQLEMVYGMVKIILALGATVALLCTLLFYLGRWCLMRVGDVFSPKRHTARADAETNNKNRPLLSKAIANQRVQISFGIHNSFRPITKMKLASSS